MADRRVHGLAADGSQVVRYERAGKWYLEPAPFVERRRRHISVDEAARIVSAGTHYADKPGGQVFDARVRALIAQGEGSR